MNHMGVRLLMVVGMSLSLAVPAAAANPSGAPRAAASTASVPLTQSFTGGGTGSVFTMPRFFPSYEGQFTSTGQLGNGHYEFGGDGFAGAFTRSDGMVLDGTFGPSHECEAVFVAADRCDALDLTGTRDIASAHLVLVMSASAPSFLMHGTLTLRSRVGYAMVDARGTTYTFGGIDHLGDAPTTDAVDLERTPSGAGYWVVNAAGQVYAFGDAPYLGNADASVLGAGERVASMSATPTGKGYWLFTSQGRVLGFGDAVVFGDLHLTALNGGIVGSVATPTGKGYYMVGRDGGVFAFGDARFRGSMGGTRLNQPVVGIVPTPSNLGYWLVAADGGVFSFNADFFGSMGGTHLARPVVAMVPYGEAYLMIAGDGGIFTFRGGAFFGSEGGAHIAQPVVGGASVG
jgi:hypothetical protein